MANDFHPAATGIEVHTPFRWTPADATARAAINIGATNADDVGCQAWQQDDNSTWTAIATGTGAGKWARGLGLGTSATTACAGNDSRLPGAADVSFGSHKATGVTAGAATGEAVEFNQLRTVRAITVPGAYPYTVLATDEIIHVDTSAARSIQLPDPATRRGFLVKDSVGTAATNNITLVRFSAENIEGVASSKVLTLNRGSWFVYSDGTNYWVNGP